VRCSDKLGSPYLRKYEAREVEDGTSWLPVLCFPPVFQLKRSVIIKSPKTRVFRLCPEAIKYPRPLLGTPLRKHSCVLVDAVWRAMPLYLSLLNAEEFVILSATVPLLLSTNHNRLTKLRFPISHEVRNVPSCGWHRSAPRWKLLM